MRTPKNGSEIGIEPHALIRSRPRRAHGHLCGCSSTRESVLLFVLFLLGTALDASADPEHASQVAETICEARGVERIVEFVRSHRSEIMWVYIPDGDSPHECQWLEVGRSADDAGAEEAVIAVDRGYLTQLMRTHRRLHIYHSHPLVYFEKCADERRCPDGAIPTTVDEASEKAVIANVRRAMPSPIDIAFMMDVWREFYQQHPHNGGRVQHRVVTPYGIVDYALTEDGKERLSNEGMEQEKGRFGFDTYIMTRVSYALLEVEGLVRGDRSDMRDVLREVAWVLSNEYLRVTYAPLGPPPVSFPVSAHDPVP